MLVVEYLLEGPEYGIRKTLLKISLLLYAFSSFCRGVTEWQLHECGSHDSCSAQSLTKKLTIHDVFQSLQLLTEISKFFCYNIHANLQFSKSTFPPRQLTVKYLISMQWSTGGKYGLKLYDSVAISPMQEIISLAYLYGGRCDSIQAQDVLIQIYQQ